MSFQYLLLSLRQKHTNTNWKVVNQNIFHNFFCILSLKDFVFMTYINRDRS